MKRPSRFVVSAWMARLALAGGAAGLALASPLACGSFSGNSAPEPGDASAADAPANAADALPIDSGSADAPIQEGCGGDPLLDPTFAPQSASCSSDLPFVRYCDLTMFGQTRSISLTTDERYALIVPARGGESNPFVLYARATPSAAFAPVKLPQFPSTTYASFFRGAVSGNILFEIPGPKAGIGTIPVSLGATITLGAPGGIPAPADTTHLSHPYQLAKKLYAASYETGPAPTLELRSRDNNAWSVLELESEGTGAGSPVVNDAETELFFRAANPYRLFRAEKNAESWVAPKPVNVPASFGTVEGWQPQWLSADGCRLYVTSVENGAGVVPNSVRVLTRR